MNLSVSVVIIGRNEGKRLLRCLQSVLDIQSLETPPEIIYVDSASTDDSPQQAAAMGAKVITVYPERPAAALGRNAGWHQAQGDIILFLDGDTVLDPHFVQAGLSLFNDPKTAIVWGHRREIYPQNSIFNRVLDLDWIYPPGITEFCGGDALIRRSILEQVNGFDETLIAGEEPELCQRIRALNYLIQHIDMPMTGHDLAMTSWLQYWRRAFRAGHAYAEVAERFKNTSTPLWQRDTRRNIIHAIILLALPLLTIVTMILLQSISPIFFMIGILSLLVLRTAFKIGWKSSNITTRLLYGIHSHLQQIPIFIGQLSFFWNRYTGRRQKLIEYK